MRAIDIADDAFFETISISEDYMFREVFGHDPKLAGQLLETVLERPVGKVEYVHDQHEARTHWDSKATVFDIYLRTKDGMLGNVEMQTGKRDELALRLRTHLSNMDRDALKRGESFNGTRESVVIAVCTFDPIGEGLRRYTVRRTVLETGTVYEDHQSIVLLNALGKKGETTSELEAFLRYVAGYDRGEDSTSGFVREVHRRVCKNRADWHWREGFMTLQEKLDARFEEGREEGRASALIGLVRDGLLDAATAATRMGISPEELRKLAETDEAKGSTPHRLG